MTGKDCACLSIERGCRQSCIDRGVLDVGMSQPILHKRQISTSIKEVRCNRMLQTMELALLHRQPCDLSVHLHEMMQHKPTNRYIAVRHKEIRRLICTCSHI